MRIKKRILLIPIFLAVTLIFTALSPVSAFPEETIRVWVSYQKGKRAEVSATLNQAQARTHYDFPELDTYVVSLPMTALKGIMNNPFVIEVEADPIRRPIEPEKMDFDLTVEDTVDINGQIIPWGIDAVQARDVWDLDRDTEVDTDAPTGAGIKVCIIDTGYFDLHEDLKDEADGGVSGMSQVDDDWLRDGGAHGSHVAGTISALNNALGVVGVSPGEVDLHIVKIFDDDGLWVTQGHASDLTAAILDCADNGANVISMSLSGTGDSKKEQEAFDSLYAAGILHVAAAGNHQLETPGELHYPASYDSVIAVAAIDPDLVVADFSAQNLPVELSGPGVNVLSTIPAWEQNTVSVGSEEYSVNHVEFAAFGSAIANLVDGSLCLTTGEWTGAVVLCSRGDNSFYEKVMNVQNSGGIAAIIYNNVVNEDLFATLGEGNSADIVAVSTTMEKGLAMLSDVGSTATVLSKILETPLNGYEAWGGTSMATPHVAGVAALVWSANPDWTNVELREAMNTTALDLGDYGRDMAYGYGLVQAADALDYLINGPTPEQPYKNFIPFLIGVQTD
jgi:subtilisin family serine protease